MRATFWVALVDASKQLYDEWRANMLLQVNFSSYVSEIRMCFKNIS